MLARLAVAAIVALAAASPALAAGTDGKTVIHFKRADAGDPADLQRVIERFRFAAHDTCLVTGSLIPDRECVDSFVNEAVMAVKNERLRVALSESVGIAGTSVTRTARN